MFWRPILSVAVLVAVDFVAEDYSTVCMGRSLLDLLSMEGRLGLFLTSVYKFLCEHFSGINGQRSVAGLYEKRMFSF